MATRKKRTTKPSPTKGTRAAPPARTDAEPAFMRSPRAGGRPPALTRIIDHAADGTPITVGDHLLATLQSGQYIEVAAARAGVSRGTVHGWLRDGARVRAQLAGGAPRADFTEQQLRCAEFSRAADEVQAVAETQDVAEHARLARGGLTVSKTVERMAVAKDGTTTVLERTVTTEVLPPNHRALEWRLERRAPARWGRLDRLEIDTGVPAVSEAERAERLADELAVFLDGRDHDDDVVDAEVVG